MKAGKIINRFHPQVAVGVGGYASGPLLYMASRKGVPGLIQEQNSYPGITNKMLASKVQKICVAYEKMERFFPDNKIIENSCESGGYVLALVTNVWYNINLFIDFAFKRSDLLSEIFRGDM